MQTEEQVRAVALEWIHKHCPVELKVAETGGLAQPDVQLINDYLQQNCGGVWSIENLNRAVETLRDRLTFRSKADLEYQAAWESLSADERAHFSNWWNGPAKKYVRLDGEEGFANASRILTWARNHTWSADVFDRAVQNLFATTGLYPAPTRQQGERRGHADDGRGFMRKDEVNVSAVERARRDRERFEQNRPQTETTPADAPDAWSRIIRGQLADGTHGQQQASKELFERLSGEGYQPRQISAELSKLQRSYQRPFSARAL